MFSFACLVAFYVFLTVHGRRSRNSRFTRDCITIRNLTRLTIPNFSFHGQQPFRPPANANYGTGTPEGGRARHVEKVTSPPEVPSFLFRPSITQDGACRAHGAPVQVRLHGSPSRDPDHGTPPDGCN